jgi:ATP-dependent DNA ligase
MPWCLVEGKALLLRSHRGGGIARRQRGCLALELEGIVGKRKDSIYMPGERTGDWRKVRRPGAVPPERFRFASAGHG